MVRVWNLNLVLLNPLSIKIIEHVKDTFIYMNLLISIILAIERYVAVCKPQHYKTLETNTNKIIWLFYLLGFTLATTNYQNSAKSSYHDCEPYKYMTNNVNRHNNNNNQSNLSPHLSSYRFLLAFDGQKHTLNLNLVVSLFLFSFSACLSTYFYLQIGRFEWRRSRKFRNNRSVPRPTINLPTPPVAADNNNDQEEDDERRASSISKSNASVQTDIALDNRVYFRKISTNFISSRTITKISVWVI